MIHVSVVDHRRERVVGVACGKLIAHMIFPKLVKTFLGRSKICVGLFLFGSSHNLVLLIFEKSDSARIQAVVPTDYLYLSRINFGLENRRRGTQRLYDVFDVRFYGGI